MNVAITDCNSKSGKTTLALNLSVALAECGSQVLLVDADPDGQLDALDGLSESGTLLDRQGLRILRSTAVKGFQIVTGVGRWFMHSGTSTSEPDRLAELFPKFDWVLFDTGAQHRSAMEYAVHLSDRVLTPLQIEPQAFRRIPDVLRLLAVEHEARSAFTFGGFVRSQVRGDATDTNGAYTAAQETLAAMSHEFPQVCLKTEIPFDTGLGAQAANDGPSITLSPPTRAAFVTLANELADRFAIPFPALPQDSQSVASRNPPPVKRRSASVGKRQSWWRRLFG